MFDSLTEEIKSDFCASFSTWHRSEKGTFSEISCPHGSQIIKTIFFFYFKELGGPAAKNPIRACALILLSDQLKTLTVSCCCAVVGEHIKVLLSASVSQAFYTEILVSHFGRKICNALKNVLMR